MALPEILSTLNPAPLLALGFVMFTVAVVSMVWSKSSYESTALTSYNSVNPITNPEHQTLDYNAHIRLGNQATNQYDYETALSHFNAALQFDEADPRLHFKIGRLYALKNNPDQAMAAFKNTLKLDANQIDARFELARQYAAQHLDRDALLELGTLLEIDPLNEEALKLKTRLFIGRKMLSEAVTHLERLLALPNLPASRSTEYQSLLAEIYMQQGLAEKAIALFSQLMESNPEQAETYELKLGTLLFQADQFEEAITIWRQLFERANPIYCQDPELKAQMAAALSNAGVLLFEAQNIEGALAYYLEALGYDQENPGVFFNLGKAYAFLKDWPAAIENYTEAHRLNPTDPSAIMELAALYDEEHQTEKAITYYEQALTLDPSLVKAAFGLGTCHGVLGNFQASIEFLSQAIRLNPKFVDAIYNLGVALENIEDYARAAQMYKKVLSLEADHLEAKSNLRNLRQFLQRQ